MGSVNFLQPRWMMEKREKKRRDLNLEFSLNQWIERVICEAKPTDQSFEQWLADGTVLSKLMRTLCFNSTEEEDGIYSEGSKDFKKWRIRTLIKQIKEYGVNDDDLFHEDDLMERANIPRVCKCLKEIAIIAQNECEEEEANRAL